MRTRTFLDIVLPGPPGEDRGIVEVEGPDGLSLQVGEIVDRGDGTWALRIRPTDFEPPLRDDSAPEEPHA